MSRRVAIIDLGTNTFNLLVVEIGLHKYETIYSTKVGVGLGFGGINENKITDKAFQRALETLRVFKAKCKELGVETIQAFGTSAIRNATNQHEILRSFKAEINLTVKVVSGEEEAALIYKGVRLGYDFTQRSVIMDIGGGSTELIVADSKGLIKAQSFEMGVSRIYQLREFADPLSTEDISYIEHYLDEQVGDFFADQKIKVLVGASGSFETCFELAYDQEYPEDRFVDVTYDHMMDSIQHIIESTLEERNNNPRIIPIRRIMAPIAAVKIQWIIQKLGIKRIIISPYAMKEGILKFAIDN
jgi:exopolyphosphatase/guanosine-5'-triphosphate,3'-diphosphate pyrophosphatase